MRRRIFEPEHEDFREAVRGFLTQEAVPRTAAWEEAGVIDRDFWRKAAEQGYVAFAAPSELGGLDLDDFRFNAIIDEEVVHTGTASDNFALVNDIVTPYLLELTTEEQRQRWLPKVTSGEIVPAIAMSEPGAGSDLRGIQATAKWNGDHWRLNGAKTFVTSGIQADLVIVAARIVRDGYDGMGLFVVEDGAEGFTRGRKLEKIGRHGQDTAELFFDDVVVPEENVIGELGKGLHALMRNLPQERLSIAVTAVASAERALEVTLDYVRTRNAFGQPVGSFQANRHALADAATEVRIARVYIDHCIEAHVNGELTPEEAAAAKYWTTELQFRVIDLGLQMHGGYGYMEEYEIARMWRDARVQRIYGGTTEIMKEIVGRSLGL
jgi:alkylation response protein AidB-like acyl-CoA dehydrogenase